MIDSPNVRGRTRILVTCFRLDLTGSSTFTLTLAAELVDKATSVDVYSPFPGILTSEFTARRINVFTDLRQIAGERYDCVIAQHNILAAAVRSIMSDVPMVFISHGVLRAQAFLEYPPSRDLNIQKYIAVSEEVRESLVSRCHVPTSSIEVVRNFVDTERFSPTNEICDRPRTILFLSNRFTGAVYRTIQGACNQLGLQMLHIGKKSRACNTEDYINEADIVISLGRGIVEAMACARAALVYDYQGADGMITEDNILEIRKHNFSGRTFKKQYDCDALVHEIERYDRRMGVINRAIVLEHHNAASAADRIMAICDSAICAFESRPVCVTTSECRRVLFWHRLIERILRPYTWRRRMASWCWNIAHRLFS